MILNTCHIREKAAEKIYSELGRLRAQKERRNGGPQPMMIGVAGCVAQAEGPRCCAGPHMSIWCSARKPTTACPRWWRGRIAPPPMADAGPRNNRYRVSRRT